jgi:CheY-like chemotaxis protein
LVVVADDDEDARTLVADAVRKLGLSVSEATDGCQVLEHAEAIWQRGEEVALVISDIGMPQCDGIEATRKLLRIRAGLPVLLMTAFSDQATVKKAMASGARHVLRKPFSLTVLDQAIRDLLAPPSP